MHVGETRGTVDDSALRALDTVLVEVRASLRRRKITTTSVLMETGGNVYLPQAAPMQKVYILGAFAAGEQSPVYQALAAAVVVATTLRNPAATPGAENSALQRMPVRVNRKATTEGVKRKCNDVPYAATLPPGVRSPWG
jgi:hypothetical protein